MHSDFSLLDSYIRETSSHSMTEFAPSMGAVDTPHMAGNCNETLTARVDGNQASIECGFVLSDEILLQHARDLTALLEVTWEAFLDTQADELRDRAMELRRQRDAARRLLSVKWQQEREAQILAACSAGYFIDAGDLVRVAASNEGTAA